MIFLILHLEMHNIDVCCIDQPTAISFGHLPESDCHQNCPVFRWSTRVSRCCTGRGAWQKS